MPLLDASTWNLPGKTPPSTVIEGEARVIPPSPVDLSTEPDFPGDSARDRAEDPIYVQGQNLRNWISKLPYGPLRTLDPKKLNTKAQFFEQLTRSLPLSEFNLPNYIYRPDMLDHREFQEALLAIRDSQAQTQPLAITNDASAEPDLFTESSSPSSGRHTTSTITVPPETRVPGIDRIQSQLEAAIVSLDYSEGFPALANGRPFWQRLDTEEEAAYDAFISYLEMGGARKRKDLIAYPPDDVESWFHINYWVYRAKAFELYRVADANKLRLHRMLQTEDSHYKVAEKLFAKMAKAFEHFSEEQIIELGVEKAIGVMEKIVKVQRISVGLSANGGAIDPQDLKKSPTTVVITQQIVQNTGESAPIDEDAPDLLVDSPDAIEQAQELIIRVQQGQDME